MWEHRGTGTVSEAIRNIGNTHGGTGYSIASTGRIRNPASESNEFDKLDWLDGRSGVGTRASRPGNNSPTTWQQRNRWYSYLAIGTAIVVFIGLIVYLVVAR